MHTVLSNTSLCSTYVRTYVCVIYYWFYPDPHMYQAKSKHSGTFSFWFSILWSFSSSIKRDCDRCHRGNITGIVMCVFYLIYDIRTLHTHSHKIDRNTRIVSYCYVRHLISWLFEHKTTVFRFSIRYMLSNVRTNGMRMKWALLL